MCGMATVPGSQVEDVPVLARADAVGLVALVGLVPEREMYRLLSKTYARLGRPVAPRPS